MTRELQLIIQAVNAKRTVLSNALSTLTALEEQMRELARFDEWTQDQEIRWMELETQWRKVR